MRRCVQNASVAIAPNGKVAFDWDIEKGGRFWVVESGRLLRTLKFPRSGEYAWADYTFSPDSKYLAIDYCSDSSGKTFLIDVASGAITQTLTDNGGGKGSPIFSQDAQWLALRKYRGGATVWHLPSGRLYRELPAPSSYYYYPPIALAGHAQLIACCGDHNSIAIFEISTGQRIGTFVGHRDRIKTLAFSNDGRLIISASEDRTALVWSLEKLASSSLDDDDDFVWKSLAGDAVKAYPILWALVRSPKRAIALAQTRMQADPEPDAMERLVTDMGSSNFSRRHAATEKLRSMGLAALPSIELALKKPNDLELHRRLEGARETILTAPPPPDLLRDLRVLQLLELIGTPDARQILQRLAKASRNGPRARASEFGLARVMNRDKK